MSEWFTVERLDRDTWAISEYKHWEETHCYLLLGRDKALLIDTGLGVEAIRPVVEGLTSLPVEVALTHAHWDHIGGCGEFRHISAHITERSWLEGSFPIPLPVVKKNLMSSPADFPPDFSVDSYQLYRGGISRCLEDGQVLELGGRQIKVLHTPGHSPGHLCFWEEERGFLFSGDLLYLGCLYAFYPTTDPVAFAASVERVSGLPVRKLWPGHHSLEVSNDLPIRVRDAFCKLKQEGRLYQGAGLFDFGTFQIRI